MARRSAAQFTHRPRRPLLSPWRRVCRCGLGGWPCHAMTMLQHQAAMRPVAARPLWDGPTRNSLRAPLMTRGQEARSRRSDGGESARS